MNRLVDRMPTKTFPGKQSGIVIIVVLMIISLMITLLVFMVEKQHVLVRRISNQNVAEQGYQYAQGMNAWAMRVLHDDQDRALDHLKEDWAEFGRPEVSSPGTEDSFSLDLSSVEEEEEQPEIDFGIDGLEVSIDDLQARYNLNNIGVLDPQQRQAQKRIFLNLLGLIDVGSLAEQEELYAALLDWIDENKERSQFSNGNTESDDYQSKRTPYYAADQKLTSIGELRFVDGFSKLNPFVTVLPIDNAKINLNTAAPELVASLSGASPVVDLGSVTSFLVVREDEAFFGFQQGDIEGANTAIIGVNPVGVQPTPDMLQVNSVFYQINVKVVLGDYQYCMKTVVLREPSAGGSGSIDSSGAPKVSVLNRQHDTLCKESSPVSVPSETDEDLS